MNRKYKILCLLESQEGRDFEMMLPLIHFTQKFFNCNITIKLVWDTYTIYRKKPDLLLLPNTIGSKYIFEAARYAYQNNIPVFALISEGNFRTDGSFDYWGYNSDKNFYQEYICHWSERTLNYFNTISPSLKDKNVLTGALGFDRYKIYDFIKKDEFFKQYGLKKYSKIITYAGWAFGKLYNEQGFEELSYFHNNDSRKIQWIKDQMFLVQEALRHVIENNTDILFVLKQHPNEANPSITGAVVNEMINLINYPNVLYIKENKPVNDFLNISDIWLGFETTTSLEAWLLGRTPTILINPDPKFKRDELYKGSIIVNNGVQLQRLIDEYYKKGEIKVFNNNDLKNNREKLIKDTIGFSDGMNHLRASFYLSKVLKKIETGRRKKVAFSFIFFIRYILVEIGKYFYIRQIFLKLPKFKKTIWIFENFKMEKVHLKKVIYSVFLDSFYKKNNITSQNYLDKLKQLIR